MLKNFKALLKRPEKVACNLSNCVEVYLQFGPFVDKREFVIEEKDPSLVVGTLKDNVDDCDHVIKFRFYDRISTTYSDGTIEIRKTNISGNYYFGQRISMPQLSKIDKHVGHYSTDLVSFEEYQVGGIIHSKSSVVIPLFANDVVVGEELCIKSNARVKQMYRKYGI